jgi:hypothetical protein
MEIHQNDGIFVAMIILFWIGLMRCIDKSPRIPLGEPRRFLAHLPITHRATDPEVPKKTRPQTTRVHGAPKRCEEFGAAQTKMRGVTKTSNAKTSTSKIIIGFSGLKGAGKDTSVKVLGRYNFCKASFAGTLKDIVSVAFGWDRTMLEGTTEVSRAGRKTVDAFWASALNKPHFTPVKALQLWGTDVVRRNFCNEFWVLSLTKKILDGVYGDRIAVSDVRFPDEARAIRDRGGIIIGLQRGELPEWYMQIRDNFFGQLTPISEELPHDEFDAIVTELFRNAKLPEWFRTIKLAEHRKEPVDMATLYEKYPEMPHESEWRIIGCEDFYICNNGTEEELCDQLELALRLYGFKF